MTCVGVLLRLKDRPLSKDLSLLDLVRRPDLTIDQIVCGFADMEAPQAVLEQVEIQAKYQGYIDRQQIHIDRQHRQESWSLPVDIDYLNVVGLSNEAREKLRLQRPETVGQAARIPGITPAAISLLLVHMKKISG